MARWISGIIIAVALVCLILFVSPFYIKLAILGLSFLASWEFFSIVLAQETILYKTLSVFFSGCGVGIFLFYPEGWLLCYFLYVMIFLGFITQFVKDIPSHEKIQRTAFFVLAMLYTVVLFGLLGKILDQPHHQFWLFLAIAVTALSDTGAYVIGKSFGKNLLAPTISPAKTMEGVLGGLVGGMIAAVGVRFFFWPEFNIILIIVLGLMVAIVGVLGDLCESLLKRGFHIKDSGKIIPGHGGILDRMDAILFTGPFVYFVSQFFV